MSGDTISDHKGSRMKLITAIVQRGKADVTARAAIRAGAPAATVVLGRGEGIREKLGMLGLAIQPEKEVILIVIDESLLDQVFDAMIKAGKLDKPGIGFAFVTSVERAVGLLEAAEARS